MAENTEGVWIDKDTGKVVHKRPTRGRQIVAPGHPIDDKAKETIARFETEVATFDSSQAVAPPEKPFPADETVTTDTPPAKKAPAKKAAAKKA